MRIILEFIQVTYILHMHIILICLWHHYITLYAKSISKHFFQNCTMCFERITAKLFFELLSSLLILSLPVFCFVFYLSPHFATTASTLLGGSLLSSCPVCNGSSTNPPSGNCSLHLFLSLSFPQKSPSHLFNLLKQLTFHLHFDIVTQKNISSSSIMLYLNISEQELLFYIVIKRYPHLKISLYFSTYTNACQTII